MKIGMRTSMTLGLCVILAGCASNNLEVKVTLLNPNQIGTPERVALSTAVIMLIGQLEALGDGEVPLTESERNDINALLQEGEILEKLVLSEPDPFRSFGEVGSKATRKPVPEGSMNTHALAEQVAVYKKKVERATNSVRNRIDTEHEMAAQSVATARQDRADQQAHIETLQGTINDAQANIAVLNGQIGELEKELESIEGGVAQTPEQSRVVSAQRVQKISTTVESHETTRALATSTVESALRQQEDVRAGLDGAEIRLEAASQDFDVATRQLSRVTAIAETAESVEVPGTSSAAPERGFGGYVDGVVYELGRGDAELANVLAADPIGSPVAQAAASAMGTSTIMLVQETPTYWRTQGVDLDANQLVQNVLFITDKAMKAALMYFGVPIPKTGVDPGDAPKPKTTPIVTSVGQVQIPVSSDPFESAVISAVAAAANAYTALHTDAEAAAVAEVKAKFPQILNASSPAAGSKPSAEYEERANLEKLRDSDPAKALARILELGAKMGGDAGAKSGWKNGVNLGISVATGIVPKPPIKPEHRSLFSGKESPMQMATRKGSEVGGALGTEIGRQAGAAAGARQAIEECKGFLGLP